MSRATESADDRRRELHQQAGESFRLQSRSSIASRIRGLRFPQLRLDRWAIADGFRPPPDRPSRPRGPRGEIQFRDRSKAGGSPPRQFPDDLQEDRHVCIVRWSAVAIVTGRGFSGSGAFLQPTMNPNTTAVNPRRFSMLQSCPVADGCEGRTVRALPFGRSTWDRSACCSGGLNRPLPAVHRRGGVMTSASRSQHSSATATSTTCRCDLPA